MRALEKMICFPTRYTIYQSLSCYLIQTLRSVMVVEFELQIPFNFPFDYLVCLIYIDAKIRLCHLAQFICSE
uniref:Uncharacterized protein n=1 Tax=Arundo donax TaxID=35708 RepID=A0A0A9S6S6_ARUDO